MITKLSMVSYATTGVFSLFIGAFADKYGLKSTNVMFTSCYGAAAFLAMIPELPVLFIGRVLSGIASAIMFSVLDAWITQDFFARKLINSGCDLYRTFGTLGVINAAAAVASSIVGDRLIWASGYNKAPLLLSGIAMWQAMQLVWGKFVSRILSSVPSKCLSPS
jgi:MFS transporter, MFS domain-containing protein family, molybdate-anion transporter